MIDRFKPGEAERMWPSYADWEIQAQHRWGLQCLRPVRRWLMEKLSADRAVEQLTQAQLLYFASCPQTLPPSWRRPLLLSMKTSWDDLLAQQGVTFLNKYGPSIADELEAVIESECAGLLEARLMWEWNATKARDLLNQPDRLGFKAWWLLLESCPVESLSLAVDALEKHPEIMDASHRLAWAKSRLPNGGARAPTLVAWINESSE